MKIFILLILSTLTAFANIGQITSLRGLATITRDSNKIDAFIGFKLEAKDILNTTKKSKLQIIFKDGTIVTVGRSSTFKIDEYLYDEKKSTKSKVNFGFLKGSFKSITGKIGKIAPEKFKLRTKNVTIGIRGTTVVGNQSKVACTYGKIAVSSHGVLQIVPAGMFTQTSKSAPPTSPEAYTAGSIGEPDVEDAVDIEDNDKYISEDDTAEKTKENDVVLDEEEKADKQDHSDNDDYKSVEDIKASSEDSTAITDIGTVITVEDEIPNDQTQNDNQGLHNELQDSVENEIKVVTEDTTEKELLATTTVTDIASQTTTSSLNDLTSQTSGLTKKSSFSDSYLEYGYWEDSTGVSVNTYVSGVVTSSDYVDRMIGNIANNATYSGGMSAIVTNSDGTKVTSAGTVSIAMDFVNQSFSGTTNVTQGNFKANVAGNIHKYGFDSTSVSAASGDTAGVTGGNLNGKFYGSTAQAAGGTFNLTSSNAGSVNGSFGLTKQLQ